MIKTKILSSSYAKNFVGAISNDNDISLLSVEDAKVIWHSRIEKGKVYSYFRLPDNNWLVTSQRTILGKWIDDFNDDISAGITRILDENVAWQNDHVIWFCIDDNTIIESKWHDFKLHWINFL